MKSSIPFSTITYLLEVQIKKRLFNKRFLKSLSVPAKENYIKFPPEIANLPSLNGDNSDNQYADDPKAKEFWLKVVEELKIAGEIVKSVQSIDTSKNC